MTGPGGVHIASEGGLVSDLNGTEVRRIRVVDEWTQRERCMCWYILAVVFGAAPSDRLRGRTVESQVALSGELGDQH